MENTERPDYPDDVKLIADLLCRLHGNEWFNERRYELSYMLPVNSTWEDYVIATRDLPTSVPIEIINHKVMIALNEARYQNNDFNKQMSECEAEERERTMEFMHAFAEELGLEIEGNDFFDIFLMDSFIRHVDESRMWEEVL